MSNAERVGQTDGGQGAAGVNNNEAWARTLGGGLRSTDIADLLNQFVAEKAFTPKERVAFNQLLNRTMRLFGIMKVPLEGCKMCQGAAFNHLMEISSSEIKNNGTKLADKLVVYADWRAFDDLLLEKGNKLEGLPSSFPLARLKVSRAIRENLISFEGYLGEKNRSALVDAVISFCSTKSDGELEAFYQLAPKEKVTTLISFIKSNISQT